MAVKKPYMTKCLMCSTTDTNHLFKCSKNYTRVKVQVSFIK